MWFWRILRITIQPTQPAFRGHTARQVSPSSSYSSLVGCLKRIYLRFLPTPILNIWELSCKSTSHYITASTTHDYLCQIHARLTWRSNQWLKYMTVTNWQYTFPIRHNFQPVDRPSGQEWWTRIQRALLAIRLSWVRDCTGRMTSRFCDGGLTLLVK